MRVRARGERDIAEHALGYGEHASRDDIRVRDAHVSAAGRREYGSR